MSSVSKTPSSSTWVASMTTTSGGTIQATAFVDASYEGDLMKSAGVSYVVGRESAAEFGETDVGGRLAVPPIWGCGCNWNLGNVSGVAADGVTLLPMVHGRSGDEQIGAGDKKVCMCVVWGV